MYTTKQFKKSELQNLNLENVNHSLEKADPLVKVSWAAETFKEGLVMSTSFGIHSAVTLHLTTQICPNIPVIWIDTGYLHHETYKFAEELTNKLQLNLKVYQSPISPSRMEATHGKLWEKNDLQSLNIYDQLRKVEPMQRALKELKATGWIAGLRRKQTNYRQDLLPVSRQGNYYKILPILNWSNEDVYEYLKQNDLPLHPLFHKGYVTVGDWHSSRPLMASDTNERDTRFQGLKEECGLHLPTDYSLVA